MSDVSSQQREEDGILLNMQEQIHPTPWFLSA